MFYGYVQMITKMQMVMTKLYILETWTDILWLSFNCMFFCFVLFWSIFVLSLNMYSLLQLRSKYLSYEADEILLPETNSEGKTTLNKLRQIISSTDSMNWVYIVLYCRVMSFSLKNPRNLELESSSRVKLQVAPN